MLTLLRNDKSKVMEQIKQGMLDSIVACNNCLIDDIVLSMYRWKMLPDRFAIESHPATI